MNEKQILPIASAKDSHVNALNQWESLSRNLTLLLRRKVAKNKAIPRHVAAAAAAAAPPPTQGDHRNILASLRKSNAHLFPIMKGKLGIITDF